VEGVGAVELLLAGRGGMVKQQLGGELPARSGWSGAAALLLACRGGEGKGGKALGSFSLSRRLVCRHRQLGGHVSASYLSAGRGGEEEKDKGGVVAGGWRWRRGFWGLHPLQQLPSGGYGALPLFSATGVVLLRLACVARACSSSFGGGSYRISAWRPSLRLPQVVSSPVEAAAAAPGGLRPSTAKLDSIASVRSLLGCFL
jgi:hypothetical protein